MSEAIATSNDHPFIAFVHLTALPAWLALSRPQRATVVSSRIAPLIAHHRAIRIRWVDVEGFSANCSDILVAEFDDVRSWNFFVEDVRDTPLFSVPYFQMNGVFIGVEDGFRKHERRHTVSIEG